MTTLIDAINATLATRSVHYRIKLVTSPEEIVSEASGVVDFDHHRAAVLTRFSGLPEEVPDVFSLIIGNILYSQPSPTDEWVGIDVGVESGGWVALTPIAGLRQSHVIMAGWCGDTPRLAFSRPGW